MRTGGRRFHEPQRRVFTEDKRDLPAGALRALTRGTWWVTPIVRERGSRAASLPTPAKVALLRLDDVNAVLRDAVVTNRPLMS